VRIAKLDGSGVGVTTVGATRCSWANSLGVRLLKEPFTRLPPKDSGIFGPESWDSSSHNLARLLCV
jgi:hypothetical protein